MKDTKVCSVGTNDVKSKQDENGKQPKWYMVWVSMISRCYDPNYHARQPTYIGCTVCDDWLIASNFKEWFDLQTVAPDSQLDKDILKHGNKVYCPEYCRFIPRSLNSLFTDNGASRGEFPIGVSYDKKKQKYIAQMSINGQIKYLGQFPSPELASQAYKIAKRSYCQGVADTLLAEGRITQEVADAVYRKAEVLFI